MQSKLDLIHGSKDAVGTAGTIVSVLAIRAHTRVIISGPSVGKTLLFSAIEADSGIESRVRRLCLHADSKPDEIKSVFAEARQVEDGVVCLDNAEFVVADESNAARNGLLLALMDELDDEPANYEVSVFFLTRTPVVELDFAIRRRFFTELELERSSS